MRLISSRKAYPPPIHYSDSVGGRPYRINRPIQSDLIENFYRPPIVAGSSRPNAPPVIRDQLNWILSNLDISAVLILLILLERIFKVHACVCDGIRSTRFIANSHHFGRDIPDWGPIGRVGPRRASLGYFSAARFYSKINRFVPYNPDRELELRINIFRLPSSYYNADVIEKHFNTISNLLFCFSTATGELDLAPIFENINNTMSDLISSEIDPYEKLRLRRVYCTFLLISISYIQRIGGDFDWLPEIRNLPLFERIYRDSLVIDPKDPAFLALTRSGKTTIKKGTLADGRTLFFTHRWVGSDDIIHNQIGRGASKRARYGVFDDQPAALLKIHPDNIVQYLRIFKECDIAMTIFPKLVGVLPLYDWVGSYHGRSMHSPTYKIVVVAPMMSSFRTMLVNSPDIHAQARLIYQAARVLKKYHDAGIVHNDIKPDNFLIDLAGNVVLCDFGFAYTEMFGRDDCLPQGTYLSPERLEGIYLDSIADKKKSDVWSLGMSLVVAIAGWYVSQPISRCQFGQKSEMVRLLANQIQTNYCRPGHPHDVPKAIKSIRLFIQTVLLDQPEFREKELGNLLLGTLEVDPISRMTIDDFIWHDYFHVKSGQI